jgi:diguanylate cyclase (GGDEF)-like protein
VALALYLERCKGAWLRDTGVYTAPDAASAETRAQHLATVTRMTPWLLLANGVNAGLVCAALRLTVPGWALILWLFALSLAWVPAVLNWRRRRGRQSALASPRAVRRAAWHAGVMALVWAVPAALCLPDLAPPQQLLLALTICGMISGGAFSLAVMPWSSLVWVAVVSTGALVALARLGGPDHQLLIGLLLVYASVTAWAALGVARQINGRLSVERDVVRQRQMVSLLLRDFEEHTADVLWEVDRAGLFVHGSLKLAQVLEAPLEGLASLGLVDAMAGRSVGGAQSEGLQALQRALLMDRPFRDVLLQVQLSSAQRWWSLTAKPLLDEQGRTAGWRGVISDVTQQRLAHQRLTLQAHCDSLTGLANREQLRARLTQALQLSQDSPRRSALLCIDLDDFKRVNDSLGHSVGDGVLVLVTQRLQSVVRRSDLVARLGGDEFAVLLDDVRSDEEVDQLAQRLLQCLNAHGEVAGRAVSIGASLGVAHIPEHGQTIDEVLGNADLALYAAKEAGRGRCVYFAPWLGARNRRLVSIELALREALARQELSLHWQPRVAIERWQVVSAEALLRWHHPDLGNIPPAEFIPVAEKSDLIGDIGHWVLMRACQEARVMPASMTISVNVSPVQLKRPTMVAEVRAALRASGLPAHRLELEITEGIFIDDTLDALTTLHELKELGVQIALDDFGTGYASLAYLRRFPFDTMKIDRAFVRELLTHHDARAIVRAIVELASVLGMSTVAEGVEEPAQLEVLHRAGCQAMQGYLVARPIPIHELLGLLHDWDPASRPDPGDMPSTRAVPLLDQFS